MRKCVSCTGVLGCARHDVLVGDVEPPGEPDPAVHHEDLFVGAQVQERHAPRQRRVQEAGGRHAAVLQLAIGARGEPTAADAVDQHPDSHAPAMCLGQRIDELPAPFVGPEDVRRQADAVLGRRDRRQHRRIPLVTIVQHRHRVAGQGRAPGDAPDAALEGVEVIVFAGRGPATPARIVAPVGRAQAPGAALHPVHTEHEIGDRPGEGCEPGQADPSDGGGDLALALQNMDGHGGCKQQAEGIHDVRTEAEHVEPESVHAGRYAVFAAVRLGRPARGGGAARGGSAWHAPGRVCAAAPSPALRGRILVVKPRPAFAAARPGPAPPGASPGRPSGTPAPA